MEGRTVKHEYTVNHEYLVSFWVEVIPEDGDTVEALVSHVRKMASEWLPEGFIFDVTPIEQEGEGEAKDSFATCPNCGSDQLEGGFVAIGMDGIDGASQDVSCLACDATWTDKYKPNMRTNYRAPEQGGER